MIINDQVVIKSFPATAGDCFIIEFKKEDVACSFQEVATNILIKKVKCIF